MSGKALLIVVVVVLGLRMRTCLGAEPADQAVTDERIEQRIQAHRTAEATLTVLDSAGRPLANTAVTVQQTRHKFLFGCNAFLLQGGRAGDLSDAYQNRFAALLNYATLPFYWGAYEPQEGSPHKDQLTTMAEWCRQGHIRTKGHPLCWHTVVPRWLEGRPTDEVEKGQLGRIERDVKAFAGLVDVWDVTNETGAMLRSDKNNPIGALCRQRGEAELLKETFSVARKTNPKATLVLNDFDTSAAHAKVVKDAIGAAVPFDVIGIQSHMHVGYWPAARTWETCERFGHLGKPIHFTEATILSGKLKTDSDWQSEKKGWDSTPEGEKQQADQVREFYRVLFSHPAVEAITWWDFSDLRAWQGAPAGLVHKDMSPKPAYEALMKLVKKDWWTGPVKLTTDSAGRVKFRGFLGDYSIDTPAGKGQWSLDKSDAAAVTITVK